MEVGFPVLALISGRRWGASQAQPIYATACGRRCGEPAACYTQAVSVALHKMIVVDEKLSCMFCRFRFMSHKHPHNYAQLSLLCVY